MLDKETAERLFSAIGPTRQDYQLVVSLLDDLDATQQRELLTVVCSQNPAYGDDERRRAFVQRLISTHPHVVRSVGPFGETALHVAAYWRAIRMMRVLMDNGADPDRPTPRVWPYNDGKIPKGSSPRRILEANIKDALENNRVSELRSGPTNFDEAATLLFGLTFEQWVEQVQTSKATPKRAQKTRRVR